MDDKKKICPKCGSNHLGNICPKTDKTVKTVDDKKKVCPKCGSNHPGNICPKTDKTIKTIDDKKKVCPKCGSNHPGNICPKPKQTEDLSSHLEGKVLMERYNVIKIIGNGPIATVYEVEDQYEGKKLAAKVLKPSFSNNIELLNRFLSESRKVGGLKHKNIVPVYAAGKDSNANCPIVVREILSGYTLKDYVKDKGKIPADKSTFIAKEILDGLEAARVAEVLNLDLTPSDIFISEKDNKLEIKLADFGEVHIKYSDDMKKTVKYLPYASPEQRKTGWNSGSQADVWSVGVMLTEMILGKNYFIFTYSEKKLTELLKDLSTELNNDELYKIIERALKINPTERYQNAGEFLNDLKKFDKDEVVELPQEELKDKSIPIPLVVQRDPDKTSVPPAVPKVPINTEDATQTQEQIEEIEPQEYHEEEDFDISLLFKNPLVRHKKLVLIMASGIISIISIIVAMYLMFGSKTENNQNTANTKKIASKQKTKQEANKIAKNETKEIKTTTPIPEAKTEAIESFKISINSEPSNIKIHIDDIEYNLPVVLEKNKDDTPHKLLAKIEGYEVLEQEIFYNKNDEIFLKLVPIELPEETQQELTKIEQPEKTQKAVKTKRVAIKRNPKVRQTKVRTITKVAKTNRNISNKNRPVKQTAKKSSTFITDNPF